MQLAGRVGSGVELGDLERRILGLQDVAQQPHRTVGEHGLGARDQHDRRGRIWSQVSCGIAAFAALAPRLAGAAMVILSSLSHYRWVQTLTSPGATGRRDQHEPVEVAALGRRADRRQDAEQLVGRVAVVVPGADPDEADRRVAAPRRGPPTGRRSRGARPSRRRPGRGAQPPSSRICDSSPRSPRRMPLRHPCAHAPAGRTSSTMLAALPGSTPRGGGQITSQDSSPSIPRSPVDTWSTSAPAAARASAIARVAGIRRRADQRAVDAPEHGIDAADVVEVVVGEDEQLDAVDAELVEARRQRRRLRAGVDERDRARRCGSPWRRPARRRRARTASRADGRGRSRSGCRRAWRDTPRTRPRRADRATARTRGGPAPSSSDDGRGAEHDQQRRSRAARSATGCVRPATRR